MSGIIILTCQVYNIIVINEIIFIYVNNNISNLYIQKFIIIILSITYFLSLLYINLLNT